jgi:hypothetical protein
MAVDWDDFIIHIKKSGQRIRYFKCTCDICKKDRGYKSKSKANKTCLECVQVSKTYLEKLSVSVKKARSTDESRKKTNDAHDRIWEKRRQEKELERQFKNKRRVDNPNFFRTEEWKKKISETNIGHVPPNKGKATPLEVRIKQSCVKQKISIEDFNGFKSKSIQNRIKHNISSRIRQTLKNHSLTKNNIGVSKILPYTILDLIKHIENQFYNNKTTNEIMTWENYGKFGWHIDHVTPDSWFNYSSMDDEAFKKSWALENLQPMWAEENHKKNNRYSGDYIVE